MNPSSSLPALQGTYYSHPSNGLMSPALTYTYSPGVSTSGRYGGSDMYSLGGSAHAASYDMSLRTIRPNIVPARSYPGAPAYTVVHTDDAATKLSDRVRRKCYNCHTTNTSTWRRSSLTLGKVLCNKCGLYERTHARPRPPQFPHRRGPLAAASFKQTYARTLPSPAPLDSSSMSSATPGSRLPPMNVPPPHYSHPSLAPLMPRTEQQLRIDTPTTIHSHLKVPDGQQSGDEQEVAHQMQGKPSAVLEGMASSPPTVASVGSSPRIERCTSTSSLSSE